MKLSANNSLVRLLRKTCHLSQAELADLVGCARLTIHNIEVGKLSLSEKMAAKISLHTGVGRRWLLDSKGKGPVCERDPRRPFTEREFKMTRAEIADPRTEPLDVIAIESTVAAYFRRLCDAAWQAYKQNKLPYFYWMVRECLEELVRYWPESRKLPDSSDVVKVRAGFLSLMEKTRASKLQKPESKFAKAAGTIQFGGATLPAPHGGKGKRFS